MLDRSHKNRGFSLTELLIVTAVIIIVLSMALPSLLTTLRMYRVAGDARGIASQLALVRMRAAAEFTQARLNFNTGAGTYQLEVATVKGAPPTFTGEGGVQYLSRGVTFTFGTIGSPPPGGQATIAQTPQIVFNSRGIPVDAAGSPTANDAIYIGNGSGLYYAVTVSASSRIIVWRYNGSSWVQL